MNDPRTPLGKRIKAIANILNLRGIKNTPVNYSTAATEVSKVLGYSDYNGLRQDYGYNSPLDERLDNIFNLLASPHALTILKILEAQKNTGSEQRI